MGFFRFRRSFKLASGVRLNVSKSGLSASIGKAGASINLRGDRVRGTVGLPGGGLSYQEQVRPRSGGALLLLVFVLALIAGIFFL